MKERRELTKQRNSEQLYNYYGNKQTDEWKEGINHNPGAHRERSRSRDKAEKEKEERMEMQSNSSFVLNKQANELAAKVDGIELSSVVGMS